MQLQFNMQSSKAAVSTSQVKIKAASLKLDLEVKKKVQPVFTLDRGCPVGVESKKFQES